jgi:hypothetical protein
MGYNKNIVRHIYGSFKGVFSMDNRYSHKIYETPTQKLQGSKRSPFLIISFLLTSLLLIAVLAVVFYPLLTQWLTARPSTAAAVHPLVVKPTPTPTPIPFDPSVGAILPTHRLVAYYAIPDAAATGPAYQLTSAMLKRLQKQGEAYQQLDPLHPVQLGIDLVASVPDGLPGPRGNYSHHLDPQTIQSYIQFCQKNGLILFLDLDFGQAPVKSEVDFFLPYLERYSFVQMAVDPEWMFPRRNGIPGIDLSNVRASDLNPIIEALAAIPMKYHVPRKVLMIHQYRSDGDGLSDPFDPGVAEIADKRHLIYDPRVDVVISVDSVGGFVGDQAEKTWQYDNWVGKDMQKYHNFEYGAFKLFYNIEAKTLMTPKQVLALTPPPLVITYGN